MAIIHGTTLAPTKLELLGGWLPGQSWYAGAGRPELTKAGGFRLDDPGGEVGIELMVVTDTSGDRPVSYLVPLSYRGAPLDGAEDALLGTAEHGVLGRRWIYDGIHDPVVVAQLLALVSGAVQAQHQNVSNTPDPSVHASYSGPGPLAATGSALRAHGPRSSDLTVDTASGEPVILRVTRVLGPDAGEDARPLGHVDAGWTGPDRLEVHARFLTLLPHP